MSRHRSPSRRHSGGGGGGGGGGWRSGGYSRRSSERSRDRSRDRDRDRDRDYYDRRDRSRSRSRDSGGDSDDGHRLHVADLSPETNKKSLEGCFRKYGPLQEVWLARNPQCFAFIVFQRKEDASDAIRSMNGKKLDGYRIRVTKARPRTRGQRNYRGYNPNLRCYECGKQGHFSRDCKKNEITRAKNSSKDRTPSSSRSSSRSRSSSSSRSGRRHKHDRSRSGSRSRSRSRSRSKRRRSRSKSRSKSRSRSRSHSRSRSKSRSRKSEEKDSRRTPETTTPRKEEKRDENGNDSALEKAGKTLVGLDYDSSSPTRSPDKATAGDAGAGGGESSLIKPPILAAEPISITLKTDSSALALLAANSATTAAASSPQIVNSFPHSALGGAPARVVTMPSEARTVTLQAASDSAPSASNPTFV